jgi:hypothetical protein
MPGDEAEDGRGEEKDTADWSNLFTCLALHWKCFDKISSKYEGLLNGVLELKWKANSIMKINFCSVFPFRSQNYILY